MLLSRLGILRYARWAVPLVAASVAAGGGVVAVSRATDSTSSRAPVGSAGGQGLALQSAFVRVVSSVSPSVVQIEDRRGLGSGIVLDRAGHIVTNNHVVTGAKAFTVTTREGRRYRARLVGSFPPDDLAVVKVSAAGLRPATFADSSRLQVGDLAIAIGNPLGLRSSVTEGIVSAFRQGMVEQDGKVVLPSVIQTSAEINPGNSGGALVDITGRVIGIPTLAATDPELGGSAPGIGFAIPSNLVADIAGQLVAHGKVVHSHRAYLGIRVGDTNGNGVLIGAVTPGGAAAQAGIRAGETITSVNRNATPTTLALAAVLAELRPGRRVPVVVKRESGAKAIVLVRLGAYPGT
jgi:S1-C subfamily serine protease